MGAVAPVGPVAAAQQLPHFLDVWQSVSKRRALSIGILCTYGLLGCLIILYYSHRNYHAFAHLEAVCAASGGNRTAVAAEAAHMVAHQLVEHAPPPPGLDVSGLSEEYIMKVVHRGGSSTVELPAACQHLLPLTHPVTWVQQVVWGPLQEPRQQLASSASAAGLPTAHHSSSSSPRDATGTWLQHQAQAIAAALHPMALVQAHGRMVAHFLHHSDLISWAFLSTSLPAAVFFVTKCWKPQISLVVHNCFSKALFGIRLLYVTWVIVLPLVWHGWDLQQARGAMQHSILLARQGQFLFILFGLVRVAKFGMILSTIVYGQSPLLQLPVTAYQWVSLQVLTLLVPRVLAKHTLQHLYALGLLGTCSVTGDALVPQELRAAVDVLEAVSMQVLPSRWQLVLGFLFYVVAPCTVLHIRQAICAAQYRHMVWQQLQETKCRRAKMCLSSSSQCDGPRIPAGRASSGSSGTSGLSSSSTESSSACCSSTCCSSRLSMDTTALLGAGSSTGGYGSSPLTPAASAAAATATAACRLASSSSGMGVLAHAAGSLTSTGGAQAAQPAPAAPAGAVQRPTAADTSSSSGQQDDGSANNHAATAAAAEHAQEAQAAATAARAVDLAAALHAASAGARPPSSALYRSHLQTITVSLKVRLPANLEQQQQQQQQWQQRVGDGHAGSPASSGSDPGVNTAAAAAAAAAPATPAALTAAGVQLGDVSLPGVRLAGSVMAAAASSSSSHVDEPVGGLVQQLRTAAEAAVVDTANCVGATVISADSCCFPGCLHIVVQLAVLEGEEGLGIDPTGQAWTGQTAADHVVSALAAALQASPAWQQVLVEASSRRSSQTHDGVTGTAAAAAAAAAGGVGAASSAAGVARVHIEARVSTSDSSGPHVSALQLVDSYDSTLSSSEQPRAGFSSGSSTEGRFAGPAYVGPALSATQQWQQPLDNLPWTSLRQQAALSLVEPVALVPHTPQQQQEQDQQQEEEEEQQQQQQQVPSGQQVQVHLMPGLVDALVQHGWGLRAVMVPTTGLQQVQQQQQQQEQQGGEQEAAGTSAAARALVTTTSSGARQVQLQLPTTADMFWSTEQLQQLPRGAPSLQLAVETSKLQLLPGCTGGAVSLMLLARPPAVMQEAAATNGLSSSSGSSSSSVDGEEATDMAGRLPDSPLHYHYQQRQQQQQEAASARSQERLLSVTTLLVLPAAAAAECEQLLVSMAQELAALSGNILPTDHHQLRQLKRQAYPTHFLAFVRDMCVLLHHTSSSAASGSPAAGGTVAGSTAETVQMVLEDLVSFVEGQGLPALRQLLLGQQQLSAAAAAAGPLQDVAAAAAAVQGTASSSVTEEGVVAEVLVSEDTELTQQGSGSTVSSNSPPSPTASAAAAAAAAAVAAAAPAGDEQSPRRTSQGRLRRSTASIITADLFDTTWGISPNSSPGASALSSSKSSPGSRRYSPRSYASSSYPSPRSGSSTSSCGTPLSGVLPLKRRLRSKGRLLRCCWAGFPSAAMEQAYQSFKARQLLTIDVVSALLKLVEVIGTIAKGVVLLRQQEEAGLVLRCIFLYLFITAMPSLLLVGAKELYWRRRNAVVFAAQVGPIMIGSPLAILLYWLGTGQSSLQLAKEVLLQVYQRPVAVIAWVHVVTPLMLQLSLKAHAVSAAMRVGEGLALYFMVLRGSSSPWVLGAAYVVCNALAWLLLTVFEVNFRQKFMVTLQASKRTKAHLH